MLNTLLHKRTEEIMTNQNGLNKSYTALFNGATKLIEEMELIIRQMKALQQEAEELYLEQTEDDEQTPCEQSFSQNQGA
jgi:3-methyladenine DNA glycosylase Mpg